LLEFFILVIAKRKLIILIAGFKRQGKSGPIK
jgi:hypothetical protein